jgi:hypothetical protein
VTNDLPDWAQVSARPDTVLPGSPIAYGTTVSTTVFDVPTGVHLLSIVLPGYLFVSELIVTGVSSGLTYFYENPSHTVYQHQYYALIPAGADTQVNVIIAANVAGTAYVTGVSDAVAVAALPQNPAPWQAPNQRPQELFIPNPGPSTAHTIVGGQPNNQAIWLHTMMWIWDVANTGVTGVFTQSNGVQICSTAAIIAGQPFFVDFKGVALDQSQGFVFNQTGAAIAGTSNLRGVLTYSVY